MKTQMFLLLLFDAVLAVKILPPLVENTCKRTPFYNLCISSLKSDPRSSTADLPKLALIMVEIIKTKATQTLKQIEDLQKQHKGLREALSDCHRRYNAVIIGDVPQAIEALEKGDYKFAQDSANDAATEAEVCEKNFSGKSPITPMNKLLHDLSVITASMVKMLLGG